MANTYTQIHLHFIFGVKHRAAVIKPVWEDELYRYITGIVQNNGHKMIIINGMPDHLHLLVGTRPTQSVSNLLQDIKGSSSKWINEHNFSSHKFAWQGGYGAFSYSRSQLPTVINYIKRQKEHHKKRSFRQEYIAFLEKFDVDYDERYIFNEPV